MLTDPQLLALIRSIHVELRGAYGSPRMTRELRRRGAAVSEERVARMMRENGIRARHKRRFRATTDSQLSDEIKCFRQIKFQFLLNELAT